MAASYGGCSACTASQSCMGLETFLSLLLQNQYVFYTPMANKTRGVYFDIEKERAHGAPCKRVSEQAGERVGGWTSQRLQMLRAIELCSVFPRITWFSIIEMEELLIIILISFL